MTVQHLTNAHYHGSPRQPVVVPDPVSTFMPGLQKQHYIYFWLALMVGMAALIGLSVAAVNTHNGRLEVLFVLLGSLLVPALYVYYLDLRNMFVEPRWRTIVITFLLGAFVSAPIAFVLEIFLPAGTGRLGPSLVTGAIEEAAKAAVVFWILRRNRKHLIFEMDGIILGAAAGMGFAAIEDMLYAVGAAPHGLSAVLATVWVREILGPFGHGTWTAIVAGTIWRVRDEGFARASAAVFGAYLLAVALHGAWDWNPVSGYLAVAWVLIVGAIGIIYLRSMIHHALGQEKAYLAQQPAAGTGGAGT